MEKKPLYLPIGEVSRLFNLRPSALRYYEEIQLMPPVARRSGRRYYGLAEMKRLALIQLLQTTGQLSLSEISVIIGKSPKEHTRTILEERIEVLERQIVAARSAKRYLEHRLTCPREDPVTECPVLEQELAEWLDNILKSDPMFDGS